LAHEGGSPNGVAGRGQNRFLAAKPDSGPVGNSEQPVQFFSVDDIRRSSASRSVMKIAGTPVVAAMANSLRISAKPRPSKKHRCGPWKYPANSPIGAKSNVARCCDVLFQGTTF
jgi:hypothetical protein